MVNQMVKRSRTRRGLTRRWRWENCSGMGCLKMTHLVMPTGKKTKTRLGSRWGYWIHWTKENSTG